jgi:ATP-dependent DNA helicase RecQ
MENPIKYIGFVRRDDIGFEIINKENNVKLTNEEYEKAKTNALDNRIKKWLSKNEKTIIYFPYASQVKRCFERT